MTPSLPRTAALAWFAAIGCGSAQLPPVDTAPLTPDGCGYPAGAADKMAEGEVLYPYRWARALHRDGRSGALDLFDVPCDTDPDIDWSPFDVLLFISVPAW